MPGRDVKGRFRLRQLVVARLTHHPDNGEPVFGASRGAKFDALADRVLPKPTPPRAGSQATRLKDPTRSVSPNRVSVALNPPHC